MKAIHVLLAVAMIVVLAACAPAPAPTATPVPAPTVAPTKAPAPTAAPAAAPALAITGAVGTPQSFTFAALQAMTVVKLTAEHPKTGKADYEGVRLSTLLDLAKPTASATKLVLTSSDGFTAEVALADVLKTPDCLMAFTSGKLNAVMPGMASNLWSKDVVKIEVK